MIWLKRFILAVQFMTRIPIPVQLDINDEDLVQSMIFYPAVGLIVGATMAMAYYLMSLVVDGLLLAVIPVLMEVAVTGAFHLDGLADVCDALISNKDREGMLAVMKDSRIGTGGAVAVASMILFKVAAIDEIPSAFIYSVLFLVPVAGRITITAAAAVSNYARCEGGLGRHFIDAAGGVQLLGTVVLGFAIMALWLKLTAVIFVAVSLAVAFLFAAYMHKKIGGMTGDTLGAACEISEAVFLFMFIGFVSLGNLA